MLSKPKYKFKAISFDLMRKAFSDLPSKDDVDSWGGLKYREGYVD